MKQWCNCRITDALNSEIDRLKCELETVKKQLPHGMKHCTIVFEECQKGHGSLRGLNWVKVDCPYCTIEHLQQQLSVAHREGWEQGKREAYIAGYERGHDDTVECCYGWMIEEKADEYIAAMEYKRGPKMSESIHPDIHLIPNTEEKMRNVEFNITYPRETMENEILARWQGFSDNFYDAPLPDYPNNAAACDSLLDTLVEKGYSYTLEESKDGVVFVVSKVKWSDTARLDFALTRREAIIAACLEVARKERGNGRNEERS